VRYPHLGACRLGACRQRVCSFAALYELPWLEFFSIVCAHAGSVAWRIMVRLNDVVDAVRC
jgi:hypothetical protein